MQTINEEACYKFKDTPKGYDVSVISIYGKYILIMPTIPVFYKYCVPMQYNHCQNFVKKYIPDLELPEKVTGLIEYKIPPKADGKPNFAIGGALVRNLISYGNQIVRQNDVGIINHSTVWNYIDDALKKYGGKSYAAYSSEVK